VRRRPKQDPRFLHSRTPERLRRFVAEEWDAATELEAAGKWYDARAAFLEETGEHADLYDDAVMPDEPFDASKI
jgi:hypothetical protein